MESAIDRSTLSLIRRVLCAHAPPSQALEDLLPPLTKHAGVDAQLYALLALVCRDYIDAWYGRITSDREFISEVVGVVGAVVGTVEARVENIDIPVLLLDELPSLVTRHIEDYRLAVARTGTISHHTTTEIFHHLQPHPALASPTTQHLYNKLLSSSLLTALLPLDHLQSPCERTFLRDLVASLVVGNVVEKMSEPHTMHDLIYILLHREDPPVVVEEKPLVEKEVHGGPAVRIPPMVETILGVLGVVLMGLKTLLAALVGTFNVPDPRPREKPFLGMAVVRLLPVYIGLPTLQPWLWGFLLLILRPFTLGRLGAAMDSLVSETLDDGVNAALVADILSRARGLLFPGNAPMGAGGPPPSEADKEAARQRAIKVVIGRVPGAAWAVYFGGGEEVVQRRVAEWYVDCWGDKDINMHLWYNVLDLVVGRLVPELVKCGPSEVLKERVGRGV